MTALLTCCAVYVALVVAFALRLSRRQDGDVCRTDTSTDTEQATTTTRAREKVDAR